MDHGAGDVANVAVVQHCIHECLVVLHVSSSKFWKKWGERGEGEKGRMRGSREREGGGEGEVTQLLSHDLILACSMSQHCSSSM